VVHRDIKPGNLLLTERHGVPTVKVLDMGLARLDAGADHDDPLTTTGQIMGTLDYMAPEQAADIKSADARADIYALGTTLWFLLTGRPCYDSDTTLKKLLARQSEPIPSLCEICGSGRAGRVPAGHATWSATRGASPTRAASRPIPRRPPSRSGLACPTRGASTTC